MVSLINPANCFIGPHNACINTGFKAPPVATDNAKDGAKPLDALSPNPFMPSIIPLFGI